MKSIFVSISLAYGMVEEEESIIGFSQFKCTALVQISVGAID